nr:lysozyme inhibitor LprI family protein [Neoroseomonas eburnea]
MSQQEMNAVSWELFLDANRELSNLMLQIKAEASKEEVKALLTAHEFWLKFREAEASREASVWEGGSIRPLMFNSAMEAITRERIAQLRWRNKNEVSEIIKINRRKTPVNIIEHIIVGVPRERVEQLLGVPYLIVGDCMYYNYEDTQVEVRLRSGVVEAVTIALCHGHKFFGTSSTGLTDIPLGQLTLADLLKADPGLSIQYNFSVRTKEVFVRPRIGPPGAWTEYCFGALVVFSGAGRLQETDFEWNHATESLSTHPRDVLINYMAIPGPGDGPPAFAWFIN